METSRPSTPEALRAVEEALQGLEYGSILISVHQGEVVGIETARKLRLKQTKEHEAPPSRVVLSEVTHSYPVPNVELAAGKRRSRPLDVPSPPATRI